MPTYRLLNRDGTFNIERSGIPLRDGSRDLYHRLLSSTWPRFFVLLISVYLLINLLFGTLYFLSGPGALAGIHPSPSALQRFLECFFFSVQTLATIGYGHISPVSIFVNVLVTIEALMGMLSIAMASGILFARFSRPTARVKFSDKATIAAVDGLPYLLFRMANARLNQIVEAQVSVILLIDETSAEGEQFRNLYDLELERSRSPVFTLSWLIAHPLDQKSPLFGKTLDDLRAANAELFVTVTGIDETFSQTVHARFSYTADDIALNAHFADVLERTPEQKVRIHLERLSEFRAP